MRRRLVEVTTLLLLICSFSQPAAAVPVRIGLTTLTGPWLIEGPARLTAAGTDFASLSIMLEPGQQAVVFAGHREYVYLRTGSWAEAQVSWATLRAAGIRADIRQIGPWFDVVPLAQQAQLPLQSVLTDQLLTDSVGGLCLLADQQLTPIWWVEVEGEGGPVRINGRAYRGSVLLSRRHPGEISAINRIGLEEYLAGVVPEEMPASWPLEALKAQTVAARTYALRQLEKHAREGYDLCDTTHCQVYGGAAAEQPDSTLAVQATAGQVLVYDGELIDAVYHAHAGGHTVSSDYAWGSSVPYLQATPIPEEPVYLWSVCLSAEELAARLRQRHAVYCIFNLEPGKFGEGERLQTVQLMALLGGGEIPVQDLRWAVGVEQMRSSKFTIDRLDETGRIMPDKDRRLPPCRQFYSGWDMYQPGGALRPLLPQQPAFYLFRGTGYGHGVGLSQWGAYGLSELGYSYREILQRFYKGTVLQYP